MLSRKFPSALLELLSVVQAAEPSFCSFLEKATEEANECFLFLSSPETAMVVETLSRELCPGVTTSWDSTKLWGVSATYLLT